MKNFFDTLGMIMLAVFCIAVVLFFLVAIGVNIYYTTDWPAFFQDLKEFAVLVVSFIIAFVLAAYFHSVENKAK